MISYASSYPSSSKISIIAKEISSASVTCTNTEKTSLLTQVTSMESAITLVSSALVAVQEQIQSKEICIFLKLNNNFIQQSRAQQPPLRS